MWRVQMWALGEPYRLSPKGLFADTPLLLLSALAAALLATFALTRVALISPVAWKIVGVAASHGALLVTALAWAGCGARAGLPAVGLLAGAAAAATLEPLGALAYASVPLWLAWRLRAGPGSALRFARRVPWPAVLAGLLAGAFLGGHLLVCASRTFGVRLRLDPGVLAAVAYDLGANVLAAEAFFRGALFDRLQRRYSLGAGLALSTAAYVARYLIDPLLPKTEEFVVGAAFYLTLLSALNCWLFWWSGHLAPGLAAGILFFVAYRLLAPIS